MLPTDIELFPPIPADTANAAQLVIRNGNFYLSIGRLANSLFSGMNLDEQSLELKISKRVLARLYLITIFQFTESLADEQAAEALQNRVDWKYALHLPLSYAGIQADEFCTFRKWLLAEPNRKQYLQRLLERLCEITYADRKPPLSRPKSDVLDQICLNNRLAIVWNALSDVLQVLAAEQPDWLASVYLPQWYQRYRKSTQGFQFISTKKDLVEFAQLVGEDCQYLLATLDNSDLTTLLEDQRVTNLRQVWEEQYDLKDGKAYWRKAGCVDCQSRPSFLNTQQPGDNEQNRR